MKIQCYNIDEFLENLLAPNIEVFGARVWFNKVQNEVQEGKSEIYLTCNAVLFMGEGRFLLEATEPCGIDYTDSSQELLGTEEFDKRLNTLVKVLNNKGIRILPGELSQ